MRTLKTKYFPSCEFLPLWNFFKLNGGNEQSLKYLVVLNNRLDYENLKIGEKEVAELQPLWDKIFQEYNALEKNFGAINFLNDKSKILYFYAIYLQEQAVLKSLLYRTHVPYLQFLRQRGYKIGNTSQEAYWESLYNGIKRVGNHLSQIEMLKNKIKDVKDGAKDEGDPYDSIMAWILSNDIKVDDNLTVTRYLKIKEIIIKRQKAKEKQNRAKAYG